MTEQELNRARELRKRICDVEWKIIKLRAGAEDLVPLLDGMPHGNEMRSRVENLAVKILTAEEELTNLRGQFVEAAVDLTEEIERAELDELEKAVLTMRYATCLNFLDIQDKLRITDATMFYVHRKALKKIFK